MYSVASKLYRGGVKVARELSNVSSTTTMKAPATAAAAAAPAAQLILSNDVDSGVSEVGGTSRSESRITLLAASTRLFHSIFPAAASGSGNVVELTAGCVDALDEGGGTHEEDCRPGGPAAPKDEDNWVADLAGDAEDALDGKLDLDELGG